MEKVCSCLDVDVQPDTPNIMQVSTINVPYPSSMLSSSRITTVIAFPLLFIKHIKTTTNKA